jgi:hypothetical protein
VIRTVFVVALTTSAAHAEDEIDRNSVRAEKLAEDAYARYAAGAFHEAVDLYSRAEQLSPAAPILFDIAYLYDHHLGAPAIALDYYRRVATSPDVTPELAERAASRRAELERGLTSRRLVTSAPAKETSEPQGGWPPMKVLGAAAATLGVVAVGASVVLGLLAKGKDDEASKFCDGDRCTDARAITFTSDATTLANTATILFVSGVITLTGGVALVLLSPKRSRPVARTTSWAFALEDAW